MLNILNHLQEKDKTVKNRKSKNKRKRVQRESGRRKRGTESMNETTFVKIPPFVVLLRRVGNFSTRRFFKGPGSVRSTVFTVPRSFNHVKG